MFISQATSESELPSAIQWFEETPMQGISIDESQLTKAPRKHPFNDLAYLPESFELQTPELTPAHSNQSSRLRLDNIFALSADKDDMPRPRFLFQQDPPLSQILSQNEAFLS
jgi:hypothetical protein